MTADHHSVPAVIALYFWDHVQITVGGEDGIIGSGPTVQAALRRLADELDRRLAAAARSLVLPYAQSPDGPSPAKPRRLPKRTAGRKKTRRK